jgi:hypothetical protein
VTALEEAELGILRRVREDWREWFPGLAVGEERVALRVLSDRPRCRLYAVTIGRDATPRAVAKVRRDVKTSPGDRRPTLSAEPLTADELAAHEFAGLGDIERAVQDDDRFRAVRPLAHLEDQATILMDYVPGVTLRDALMRRSRLRLPPAGQDRLTRDPWVQVGGWLRTFQCSVDHHGRPARQSRREEILERFDAYGRFLEERLGRRPVAELAHRGAQLASHALPDPVPLATGHGDFAPRNMFVCPDGRLAVFDPLVRWAVPAYEDVGRFLVGLRLLGLQVHSHGLALNARLVDTADSEVVEAFRHGGSLQVAALRSYQLLLLLDKWSALVADPSPGWRGRVRRTSLRLASSYIRRQGLQVLESASA